MSSKKFRKYHKIKALGDVTLNDFANSTVVTTRSKKVHSVTILENLKVEKIWDEKDDALNEEFVEIENTNGIVSSVLEKKDPQSKLENLNGYISENGKSYPIDIWFLISEYVQPEDVGRFAAICKAACQVVNSAQFWFNLYKRFQPNCLQNLPMELQPLNIMRKFGLRTSVIRVLHYCYPLFRKSCGRSQHPEVLKRMQCISMWYRKCFVSKVELRSQDYVNYYFKMQHQLNKKKENRNLLEVLDDIKANHEENYRILCVKCKGLRGLPSVLGLTLLSASITLSSGFIEQQLQLVFSSGIYQKSCNRDDTIRIVLDHVIDYAVLDWWHPRYPYRQNLDHLISEKSDEL